MEKGRRDTVLLTVIAIATLLVAIVGATFAYFTAQINGNNRTSTVTITSSSGGGITFYGTTLKAENIYPRDNNWGQKAFKVTYHNDNALVTPVTYELTLNYTSNFGDTEVQYSLENLDHYCTGNSAALTSSECTTGTWTATDNSGAADPIAKSNATYFTSSGHTADLGDGTFDIGTTDAVHSYTLTIWYPNKEATNQNNAGQGKTLTAWISIRETSNDAYNS